MEKNCVALTLADLIFLWLEYLEDGHTLLLRHHDVNSLPNAIPKPGVEDNTTFQAASTAADVPKNPEPHFAFGVYGEAPDLDWRHINKISKGMRYPLLVMEWKSSDAAAAVARITGNC